MTSNIIYNLNFKKTQISINSKWFKQSSDPRFLYAFIPTINSYEIYIVDLEDYTGFRAIEGKFGLNSCEQAPLSFKELFSYYSHMFVTLINAIDIRNRERFTLTKDFGF